jgi:hypothetical protein
MFLCAYSSKNTLIIIIKEKRVNTFLRKTERRRALRISRRRWVDYVKMEYRYIAFEVVKCVGMVHDKVS